MGVGSFVEDLRNFVELTHVVSVTNAVWWTSSRLFLFARQRKLAYLPTIKKGAIKSIKSLKQRKVRYSRTTLIPKNLLTVFVLKKTLRSQTTIKKNLERRALSEKTYRLFTSWKLTPQYVQSGKSKRVSFWFSQLIISMHLEMIKWSAIKTGGQDLRNEKYTHLCLTFPIQKLLLAPQSHW